MNNPCRGIIVTKEEVNALFDEYMHFNFKVTAGNADDLDKKRITEIEDILRLTFRNEAKAGTLEHLRIDSQGRQPLELKIMELASIFAKVRMRAEYRV